MQIWQGTPPSWLAARASMVLEAAGEDEAGLIPAVLRSLGEIGVGQVLEVVAGLGAIPGAVAWCLAHGVEVLHLEADRAGGRFWVRQIGDEADVG